MLACNVHIKAGAIATAAIELIETVRQIAVVASQILSAAIATIQFNTNKIPTPVATDLPPLKPSQTGQL